MANSELRQTRDGWCCNPACPYMVGEACICTKCGALQPRRPKPVTNGWLLVVFLLCGVVAFVLGGFAGVFLDWNPYIVWYVAWGLFMIAALVRWQRQGRIK